MAYLLLFEGESGAPVVSVLLIAGALLSNLVLSRLPEKHLLGTLTLGLIICSDIAWIATALWHKGSLGSDVFFLYFFILCLAAIGQNIILVASASVVLGGMDLILFVFPEGEARSIWTSPSLVRIPFMFIVAVFYGHLVEKLRQEKEIGERRIQGLQEIDLAITSSLDLRHVLKVLFEKIDLILPQAGATVRLLNKNTGELEPVACRNLDEEAWRKAIAGSGPLSKTLPENHAPLIVRNAQTDPRSLAAEFPGGSEIVSFLRVPLIAKGEVLGVLTFFTNEELDFSSGDVKFLTTLAAQAAIAIHNSQLYEETVKANRAKDEFLGIMSHELRTPLSVITGYTAMLKEKMLGEVNSAQEKALQKIADFSTDLLTMIQRILYVTSIEGQAVKLETREVDLVSVLNQVKLSYEVPMQSDVVFHWDFDSSLPVVKTDAEKLKHILENLINNAVKFTPQGKVMISARSCLETKRVEFRVMDTGIGIPKRQIQFIFDKFRQLDSSDKRNYGGTGLGLYIVKKFAEMLGGTIDVESELGHGSTFTLSLPYGD